MKKISLILTLLFPAVATIGQLNVSNVTSNSNGTLENITDDYITFSMNPLPPVAHYVDPYRYSVTATQGGVPVTVTLSDGSSANSVRYASYLQYFRLPAGSAGKGNVTITVDPAWGSFPNTVGTLTDPGTTVVNPCAVSGSVTYRYQSPIGTADANNWQAMVPKFNVPGKTLTGISINYVANGYSIGFIESRSVNPVSGSQIMVEYLPILKINGTDNYMSTLSIINSSPKTLAGAQVVPALGAWPGDNLSTPSLPSTLLAMEENFNIVSNSAISYLDPRLSPQWVTNFAGIPPSADDDILVEMGHGTGTGSIAVPAASFSSFTGSGNAPVTFSSLTSFTTLGSGGNGVTMLRTAMSFSVEVTYNYTSAPCQPVSGSVYLDQDGPANGINNQAKFTGAATLGLKAVLADANGIVIDVVNIDGAGNYIFADIVPAAGYTVRITTQSGITKGTAAPVPTLGASSAYIFAGEFNGGGTGTDGNVDGISAGFTVGSVPVTQVDLAITNATSLSANFTNLFAEVKDGQLLINFSTLGETNNDHFEIEASRNGVDFVKIGEVKSKSVNGNSTVILNYAFSSNSGSFLLGLSVVILSLGGVYSGRKHRVLVAAITSIVLIAVLGSCNKDNNEVSLSETDILIRIAQVDTDGKKTYSKTIKAIRK